MAKQEQPTRTKGRGATASVGVAADRNSYGPDKNIRRIKGLLDLRRAYYCPHCRVQGRPLRRVWGVKAQVAAHRRSGYVKYMGPDRGSCIDFYECRHCGEPWWVKDRYERLEQAEELDAEASAYAPPVA